MSNCMFLLSLFLNHNHRPHNHNYRLHNCCVHNYNYRLHNNYRTITWTSMIQCLHTITLKQKTSLTFILHTHNYCSKMTLFLMSNKPPLTNKIIIHHNILCHPHHNNHKHKHQIEMNIPSLTKIPLYDFTKKTWIILVSMRIKSCFITTMTKAMTKVLPYQRHLYCNITNLGIQWI